LCFRRETLAYPLSRWPPQLAADVAHKSATDAVQSTYDWDSLAVSIADRSRLSFQKSLAATDSTRNTRSKSFFATARSSKYTRAPHRSSDSSSRAPWPISSRPKKEAQSLISSCFEYRDYLCLSP